MRALGHALLAGAALVLAPSLALAEPAAVIAPAPASTSASTINSGTLASAYGGSRKLKLGTLISANFNTTADQAITLSGSSAFVVTEIIVTNCSATPTAAQGTFYTAASKGGYTLFGGAASSPWGALTAPTVATVDNSTSASGSNSGKSLYCVTSCMIYLSLTTPQGSPLTCDIYPMGDDLS